MMQYPCIVYRRNAVNTEHADNFPYKQIVGYQVTVIDPDPDSDIPEKIRTLPLCTFDRHYTADNLNHDAYNIFY